ncbi:serine hydrolase domain-containing protein [Pseudoalteromonas luteoviolacea]|nr:serine hydrolase [Pseudoalteromonas luteoviolacea]
MLNDINDMLRSAALIMCCICFYTHAHSSLVDYSDNAPYASEAEKSMPFGELPYLKKPFIDLSPESKNDLITIGEFGKDGGDPKKLQKLINGLEKQALGRYDSMLIAHHGKLVFESYYLRGRADLPHRQASTTKAYLSFAVGRAIQLGYLNMSDLNKPIASFFKGLKPAKFAAGVENITLHLAMTMRSGLRISKEQMTSLKSNPINLKGKNQVQAFFETTAPISNQQQTFHYQSLDPILVMQVLNVVTPNGARAFIRSELLNKLGIVNFEWRDDISGLPMGAYASSMLSRDMLKFALLTVNNGMWQGVQLIPKAFVEKATQKIVPQKDRDIFFTGDTVSNASYGYYWWQADMKVGNKSYSTRSAQGGGGQYVVLIDELDLIVVTTAHERNDQTMKVIAEKVLPIFSS